MLLLLAVAAFLLAVVERDTVPPSLPKRNSAKRRFNGSLLGRISSVNGPGTDVEFGVEAAEKEFAVAVVDVGMIVLVCEYKPGKVDSKDKI